MTSKLVFGVLLVGMVLLYGCLDIVPQGQAKDCGSDDACIMNALKDNCTNAHAREIIYDDNGTEVIGMRDMDLENKGNVCIYTSTVRDKKGNFVIGMVTEIDLPMAKCTTEDGKEGYRTNNSTCKAW